MKKTIYIFSLVWICSTAQAQPVEKSAPAKQLIVKYGQHTSIQPSYTSKKFRITPLYRGRTNHSSQHVFTVELNELDTLEKFLAYYQSLADVLYAEPDFTGYAATRHERLQRPDDLFFSRQWSHDNDGSFPLSTAKEDADVDLTEAWGITQGNEEIIVAILDSGIKPDHPEFEGRLWFNEQEIPENNKDDDGNGYVDDVQGWNFVNENNIIKDNLGHGTHIAGIIGASGNNRMGYAGADWKCRLMVCKVLNDDYSGLYSWWAKAIYYAVDNGAKVINMSLGGIDFSKTLRDAVDYAHSKNVLVVASMQNGDTDEINYPAGYTNALAVGSTDPDDTRSKKFSGISSYGSNYGNHIDLVAPGNYIYGLSHTNDQDYTIVRSGTSQSAALVSGITSLVWSVNVEQSVKEIERIILSSAEDRVGEATEDTKGWDQYYGHGRINAYDALRKEYSTQIETGFQMYPNPAVGEVFLTVPYNAEKISIQFVNNLGQYVQLIDVQGSRESIIRIDTGGLPRGIYQVLLKTDTGVADSLRLLLQ